MKLTEAKVLEQSRTAMKQWEDLWRVNATKNNEVYKRIKTRLTDLLFRGSGRIALVVAFGHSFEKSLETIKKWRGKTDFDVICVDKCLKFLDFAPDYVVIADASVSYDEWMKGADTSKTTLIANICSHPDWAKNWQGPVVFYVNKDNIKTEEIYGRGGCSDCEERIPASSNVGNAAVVIASTIFNYDVILLTGYDYCFGNRYYAFYDQHTEAQQKKKYYMGHRIAINGVGDIVRTSENLLFSAKWLADFLRLAPDNIFNTTKETILNAPYLSLDKQLRLAKQRELTPEEKQNIVDKTKQPIRVADSNQLNAILQKESVTDITVNIIPEAQKWVLN